MASLGDLEASFAAQAEITGGAEAEVLEASKDIITEGANAAAEESDDKSIDPEDLCSSCHKNEGDERLFQDFNCQDLNGLLFCDECLQKMPEDVKSRRWCGNCRSCYFGKIKVKLGKKGRKGKKEKKGKLLTCGRGCKGNWDVRCRCEINCPEKNSVAQFLACSQRISSMAFWIANEYELYKKAIEGDFTYLDQFDFSDEDKIGIITAFQEDR